MVNKHLDSINELLDQIAIEVNNIQKALVEETALPLPPLPTALPPTATAERRLFVEEGDCILTTDARVLHVESIDEYDQEVCLKDLQTGGYCYTRRESNLTIPALLGPELHLNKVISREQAEAILG